MLAGGGLRLRGSLSTGPPCPLLTRPWLVPKHRVPMWAPAGHSHTGATPGQGTGGGTSPDGVAFENWPPRPLGILLPSPLPTSGCLQGQRSPPKRVRSRQPSSPAYAPQNLSPCTFYQGEPFHLTPLLGAKGNPVGSSFSWQQFGRSTGSIYCPGREAGGPKHAFRFWSQPSRAGEGIQPRLTD